MWREPNPNQSAKKNTYVYAPFTRGKEQVYISFVQLTFRKFFLLMFTFFKVSQNGFMNDLLKNVFCSCFMNTAHWAENCILGSSFSFELFLRLIKTQEMCVFVWSGLSWKVWSTVRWAPLQTWSPFTESQNEKQSLGLRTHSCSLNNTDISWEPKREWRH